MERRIRLFLCDGCDGAAILAAKEVLGKQSIVATAAVATRSDHRSTLAGDAPDPVAMKVMNGEREVGRN
jgi:hypothetical protein